MNSNRVWDKDEWEKVCSIIRNGERRFREGFIEWLSQRPLFWSKFASVGLEAEKRNDPYGYSALALLEIVEFEDFSEDENQVILGDYRYARELGRLLIDLYPETYESLWRGERYEHPMCKDADAMAKFFEEANPEYVGFFCSEDTDPYNDPGYMVFPELAGLPKAEPVKHDSETANLN